MRDLYDLLRLARPSHWIKNFLVFAALLFSRKITDATAAITTCLAFVAFCLVSSAVYAWNDVVDRREDAQHPNKCRRPVAAGQVSPRRAVATGLLLAALALGLAWNVGVPLAAILGLYLLVMTGYVWGLKRLAILDVLILASGFAMRAYAGGVAAGVPVSPWLMLCTLNLALFLGFAKRESERAALGEDARKTRVLQWRIYDARSLGDLMVISAALAIMTYMIYTVSPETIARTGHSWMCLTVLPAVYGVLRFYRMAITGQAADPIDLVRRDPAFVIAVLVWLGMVALCLFV